MDCEAITASLSATHLQFIGTSLNFFGAILLAAEFWKKRDVRLSDSEVTEYLLRICAAMSKTPPDRDALSTIRQEAAAAGAEGRAEDVQRGVEIRVISKYGRWGIVAMTLGFFVYLTSFCA